MRKITADLIVTNEGSPLRDHCILIENSKIIDIVPSRGLDGIEKYKGVLTPGFVNAHCHLELSHLKNQIDTGTGLISFIKGVVTLRDFPQEEILEAIIKADAEMQVNGIVAVGDISNKADTVSVKDDSPIRYYTFVEMFDFLQSQDAQKVFDGYYSVYASQSSNDKNRKSCVPHAPYSVSPELFQLIDEVNTAKQTISIHNQELAAENDLFLSKSGGFIDFYNDFGISLDHFEPTGLRSIDYALQHMDPHHRTLMVHNTQSNAQDIATAHTWSDEIYWVTCPNANLYIENKLPDYKIFIAAQAKMCIGTDSLTSNWGLSIIEEMKTIKKYQSYIDDMEIIKWATINGAMALGFDDTLGSITQGKMPGINLLDVSVSGDGKFDLREVSQITKLV